jgi:hypothetical protein
MINESYLMKIFYTVKIQIRRTGKLGNRNRSAKIDKRMII